MAAGASNLDALISELHAAKLPEPVCAYAREFVGQMHLCSPFTLRAHQGEFVSSTAARCKASVACIFGGIVMTARLACALLVLSSQALAQPPSGLLLPPRGTAAGQLGEDPYTRYELLEPGSGKFRIRYEVTADQPGAVFYFNPIRKGSIASDEHVTDLATGKPLQFRIVTGTTARSAGMTGADLKGEYLQVTLARPVPANGGEGRILIEKTYEDAKSYHRDGDAIVFDRPLGINRNAVVLPAGYKLVSCNFPSQVLQKSDGRIMVSFWNVSPAQAPLILKAKRGAAGAIPSSVQASKVVERAHQSREIVYLLQQPETHRFDLYHDYTETRPGVSTYVNIVRTGSKVSNPSGLNLDTGLPLQTRIVRGAEIAKVSPEAKDITSASEAVLFSFPAVPAGGSTRLRFAETYADPGSYRLIGDELVLERSLGRAVNAVILPSGWVLTNSSVPAIVSELPDGRTRLDYLNPRTDELQVSLTARRRMH